MPILSYKGASPRIAKDCFVAETATIVGNVVLEEGSSVWYGAVLRAEAESIEVGRRSNIQDNCVVHTDLGYKVKIDDNVTIGHGTIIHGASVGSNSLVGMGVILLNGSKVGRNCVIGAGSLVTQDTVIADNTLALGSPASPRRLLKDEEIKKISVSAQHYFDFRADYLSL